MNRQLSPDQVTKFHAWAVGEGPRQTARRLIDQFNLLHVKKTGIPERKQISATEVYGLVNTFLRKQQKLATAVLRHWHSNDQMTHKNAVEIRDLMQRIFSNSSSDSSPNVSSEHFRQLRDILDDESVRRHLLEDLLRHAKLASRSSDGLQNAGAEEGQLGDDTANDESSEGRSSETAPITDEELRLLRDAWNGNESDKFDTILRSEN